MEIVHICSEDKSSCITVSDLVDEYGDDVYKFCRRLTYSKEDAEDLFQETFLKTVEYIGKINASDNPRAFVFTITSNTWKSWKRKHARRLRLAPVEPLTEDVPGGNTIEESVLNKDEARIVRDLVNGLPESLRLPVILYYTLEMHITDIAATMRLPPGTIKSRLFKAREMIRKGLKQYE